MNILIVEDEPMILKGISFLIQQYDYPNGVTPNIFVATNGMEADQLLCANSFDFIFTDIKMPEMDGIELINKWAGKKPMSQWVIVSGFNDFEYAKQAIQNGAKDYLLKPITKRKIYEVITRLVENRAKLEKSFITISQSHSILENLENMIWDLDAEAMKDYFFKWASDLSDYAINFVVYHHYLEEVLEIIVSRFKSKGVKDLTNEHKNINCRTKEELEINFIERCLAIIDIIKVKRKGNVIDPIDAAKEYIGDNLNDRLNLTDVAEKLGFNPTYFSQLFKKETGESFVAFRRRVRMEKAKELLEMDEMRIIDISNEIGYGDLPHFTKSFKKYTGYTPSEYKQRLGISIS